MSIFITIVCANSNFTCNSLQLGGKGKEPKWVTGMTHIIFGLLSKNVSDGPLQGKSANLQCDSIIPFSGSVRNFSTQSMSNGQNVFFLNKGGFWRNHLSKLKIGANYKTFSGLFSRK